MIVFCDCTYEAFQIFDVEFDWKFGNLGGIVYGRMVMMRIMMMMIMMILMVLMMMAMLRHLRMKDKTRKIVPTVIPKAQST